MLGANADCCGENVGLDFDGGLQIGDNIADLRVRSGGPQPLRFGTKPDGGFLKQVEAAVQKAVHPDAAGNWSNTGVHGSPGAEAIPFPVVSPYRPLTVTRAPIAGLTAFPKAGYYFNGDKEVRDFNVQGDEDAPSEMPGFESLGFFNPGAGVPSGFSLEQPYTQQSSGPGRLSTILNAISTTLPATVSAFKGQPYYNPAQGQTGLQYGGPPGTAGYPGGAGANIGSQAGAAVGNIGDTVSNIVSQNPLLVLGLGAAALLLFMKPPSRR